MAARHPPAAHASNVRSLRQTRAPVRPSAHGHAKLRPESPPPDHPASHAFTPSALRGGSTPASGRNRPAPRAIPVRMPSVAHETLLLILRAHPEWLLELLDATGVGAVANSIPAGLAVVDGTLRVAPPVEVRADLLLARGERGPWMMVEVQLEIDEEKVRRWLLATAVLFDSRGTMGDLVVITPHAHVARWARAMPKLTGALGTRVALSPCVVWLSRAVAETLLDDARPELAFFAAWAMQKRHGRAAKRIVREAVRLAGALPEALQAPQIRAILSVASEKMFAWLKETAMIPATMPESPWIRRYREELEARGKAEWKAEGKAEGKAEDLLAVFAARQITVGDATRTQVIGCKDAAQLDAWIRRAATATSVDDVFRSG